MRSASLRSLRSTLMRLGSLRSTLTRLGSLLSASLKWSVALALVFSPAAKAQLPAEEGPVLVDFDYQAQPECIEEDRAFALVRRRSSRVQRADDDPNSQRLVMEVVRDGSGYRGTLTVVRPGHAEERRSMKGTRCDEVVEALALTAALSIDPDATLTLGPAVSEETASQQPVVEQTDIPPPVSPSVPLEAESASEKRPVRPLDEQRKPPVRVMWGATVDLQKLMKHTVHLGAGSTVALSGTSPRVLLPLEVRLGLHFLTQPSPPVEGVMSRFFLLRLAYCAVRVGRELSMMLCPATELGLLWAGGRGFLGGHDSVRPFVTLGADVVLRARIAQRVELWAAPTIGVPLTKRRYVVDPGPEEVSSSVDVMWGGSSGVGLLF